MSIEAAAHDADKAIELAEFGRHTEAEAMIDEVRDQAIRLGNQLDLVRLTWLGGRIANFRGEPQGTEAAFEQVHKEFLTLDIAYDTALVSLELAVLYLGQDRTAEVQELTRQLVPVFQAQKVSREAFATIKLFCEAVERETITLEMAHGFLADLRRAGK